MFRDERYQVADDLRLLGRMGQNVCPVCINYNGGQGNKKCISCPKMDNFEWRGVVKEEQYAEEKRD